MKLTLVFLFCAFSVIAAGAADGIDEIQLRAESGSVKDQVWLASNYDFGRGVPQDYKLAAHWYEKAASAGNRVAQNNLASLYQNGLGVGKDLEKAFVLYTKSAEQGFPMAKNSLGMMYDLGLGVAQDRETGNRWYLSAAEDGVPEAMLNLGLNTWHGEGVPADPIEAFKWLDMGRFFTQRSADMRLKWRIRGALDQLKSELDRKSIKEGEKRSSAWYEAFRKQHKT